MLRNFYGIKAFFSVLLFSLFFSACQPTFHEDKLEEGIKGILKKEYNISNVKVKVVGKTIAVFVPFDKLFSANLSAFSMSKNVSPESMFKFDKNAMDTIESVLFATSRVILSTDRKLDFYVLKAIEESTTGFELSMTGYIMDMKLVRFWNISISEYRKRLLYDIGINKPIVCEKTLERFFDSISFLNSGALLDRYFVKDATLEDISPFFYAQLAEAKYKSNLKYTIEELKIKPFEEENSIVVYAKIREDYITGPDYSDYIFYPGVENEYIFVLKEGAFSYKIAQVIPFYYISEDKVLHRLEFPEDMEVYRNIGEWEDKFYVEEVHLGAFLGSQLTKRMQDLLTAYLISKKKKDFLSGKIKVEYFDKNDGYESSIFMLSYNKVKFLKSLGVSIEFMNRENYTSEEKLEFYRIILKEFIDVVVKGYKFEDFAYLDVNNLFTPGKVIFKREELERVLSDKHFSLEQLIREKVAL